MKAYEIPIKATEEYLENLRDLDISVRRCRPADQNKCYAILKSNMFRFFSRPGEWNDEKVYHEFWSPEIRVLERKDEVIGYFYMSITGEKAWLRELQIASWMQGQGIGRKVMGFLESEATDNGATVMALCVLKDNTAQAFYAKRGYRVVDEDEGDAARGQKPIFIMEKNLRRNTKWANGQISK